MDQVLGRLPRVTNENVLVGFDTADDAGVYKLTPECALVQTVDFFTPIVDDPFTYGAIAAANALSDVYAMGGRPLSALSIVAFPAKGELDILEEILKGGAEKIREASCVILGGHSISDDEIKFGYAVTGTIHPDRIMTNAGARPGDALVFTKKIGTGIIATALKRGLASDQDVQASVESMLHLNREACEAMLRFRRHTDARTFPALAWWATRWRWRTRAKSLSRLMPARYSFFQVPSSTRGKARFPVALRIIVSSPRTTWRWMMACLRRS